MTIITDFNQLAEGGSSFADMIPEHTLEALDNYFIKGFIPGGFLTGLIVEDYEKALGSADHANRARFWYVARWLTMYAPRQATGSYLRMADWNEDKYHIRTKYVDQAEKDFEWRTLSGDTAA